MTRSRREFLRAASGLALSAGAAGRLSTPFAMSLAGMASLAAQSSAVAADASGYKALVCLFMNGGNDSHNWVVPVDPSGYAEYARARTSLALPTEGLTGISTATSQGSGRAFGMPNELSPLRALYEQGKAAVVANVGTLVQPVTKADFMARRGLPLRLFSHNDQASTWQSLLPEGARSGWGGRMGDILMSANAQPAFTAISTAGNAVFLSGNTVSQYQVGAEGPIAIRAASAPGWVMGSDSASVALRRVLADGGNSPFQRDYKAVVQRSMDAEVALRSSLSTTNVMAIPATPLASTGLAGTTTLDQDPLAQQLRMVARLISTQQTLGMRRQVFMVSMGGFDTHSNQRHDHSALSATVANAISYFYNAINALGLSNQVTLFTASDFGRTMTSNGNGSDHGWGSHHIVVGGAVKGRDIYGRMPIVSLGTDDDIGSGRLIPSTSVSQYAATMGKWFGLSSSELQTVLPGLAAFSPSTLGFL